MRVKIYTLEDRIQKIEEKLVWKGKMKCIPCVGEYIIVNAGFCSEPIKQIHYDVENKVVSIYIESDTFDAYADVNKKEIKDD